MYSRHNIDNKGAYTQEAICGDVAMSDHVKSMNVSDVVMTGEITAGDMKWAGTELNCS